MILHTLFVCLAWWGLDFEGNFRLAPHIKLRDRILHCKHASVQTTTNADTILKDLERVIGDERKELRRINRSLNHSPVQIGKQVYLLSRI